MKKKKARKLTEKITTTFGELGGIPDGPSVSYDTFQKLREKISKN